eukprot:s43_g27.t1
MDVKDPFRDLAFDGRPAGYREFRRKVILSVASLEDKQQHLAGPRLLNRLSGEAWRATEHLSVASIRSNEGWLEVLKTLDKHYKYLPETELHEAIDEFLFLLRRRGGEGATAFASRFKTQLNRLETLIAQERALTKKKRRKKKTKRSRSTRSADQASSSSSHHSSLEESDHSGPEAAHDEPTDGPDESQAEQPAAPAGAAASSPTGPAAEQPAAFESPRAESKTSKASKSSHGHHSAGTWKADQARAQLRMQRVLGTVEASHTKPKPVFPQSVLGRLFMRKFGLSKEQRAQVIRATGGSSRFSDIERILRASDFEETKSDDRRGSRPPQKVQRRDAYAVQSEVNDDDSSLDVPLSSESGDEVYAGEHEADDQGDSTDEDIQEILEIQKKAKKDFKKNFRTYKESKKKVREIKKSRQPFFPVVAIPPEGQGGATSSQNVAPQGSKKYEKKVMTKNSKQYPKTPYPRKEEAHLAVGSEVTEFNYMVNVQQPPMNDSELDVLLASIPAGFAILDTGATTSVVGADTASRYAQHFAAQGFPPPVELEMPPVELRGFSGKVEKTSNGLRWTVKLGELYGSISTYVVPGSTPFLLSRRVLENMEALIDMGQQTITSHKHGMKNVKLSRSANGHLLLPICPAQDDFEIQPCETDEPNDDDATDTSETMVSPAHHSDENAAVPEPHALPETEDRSDPKPSVSCQPVSNRHKITEGDRKRSFQTILKNTKNGIVDLAKHKDDLIQIYGAVGSQIEHAFVGYKPKLERIPHDVENKEYLVSVVSLDKDKTFNVSPWQIRPSGVQRRPVSPMPVALFCFRAPEQTACAKQPSPDQQPICMCCSEHDAGDTQSPDTEIPLETLYEESDWVDVGHNSLPSHSRDAIRNAIKQLRTTSIRVAISQLADDPDSVRTELAEWLGDQSAALDTRVGLIEVFTGHAPLSQLYEQTTGKSSIRLGLTYGQDFTRVRDRRLLLLLIAFTQPEHVWFSWPCKHWGPWCNINMSKDENLKSRILEQRQIARRYLHMVSEAWQLQTALGGHCHAENPLSSYAWSELSLGPVWVCRVDQCALGLRSPKTKNMIMKPTKLVTTQQDLVEIASKYRCDGNHKHDHLEGAYKGRNLTSWAETYPRKFCKIMVGAMMKFQRQEHDQPRTSEEILAMYDPDEEELRREIVGHDDDEDEPEMPDDEPSTKDEQKAVALVRRLHVNTSHASPEQLMRLANRCKASETIKKAIRSFKCPVCEELKPPSIHRKATIAHAESPNQVFGVDFVQVELKKEGADGKIYEIKRNVLTCVCLATDFAQQIVVPPGRYGMSKAFHDVWVRPYGVPKTVYMDPDHRNISHDFQQYLAHQNIQLLHAAAESHWQLGRVEISNRVLRNMAQKVWRTTHGRSPEEVIEMCGSVRNDYLRKCGFSPSQWFLGREPRHAASLADVDEQHNPVTQSQVLADPKFASLVMLREQACQAFLEEHAKEAWRRAISGRNRPMRGPYVQGQLVYMFRRRGRGQLSTRHGVWLGPGRIVGTESSTNGVIPRLIWVSYNGFLYRCSPEGLRPLPEDEHRFRELTKELSAGRMHPEIEQASQSIDLRNGQYHDLVDDKPTDEDMELQEDLMDDADDNPIQHDDSLEPSRKLRRRYTRSPEYWAKRASGELGPMGALQEGTAPTMVHMHPDGPDHEETKRRRVTIADPPEQSNAQSSMLDDPAISEPDDYIEPSLADEQEFDDAVPGLEGVSNVAEPPDETTDAISEAPATMPADAPENEDAVQLDNAVNTAVPNEDDEDLLVTAFQGVQDKATVSHVTMFNKACRELKEKKLCLRFPSTVPISSWRILCIADAGWGTRESGDSQGKILSSCRDLIRPEAMGSSEEPLSATEVSLATGLLARAVKFGQQREILSGFITQPGGLKSFAVAADAVMKEVAAKRNRDEAERLSAGFEESEWDELSFNGGSPQSSSYQGGRSIPPPMPDGRSHAHPVEESHPYENVKIPLPAGVMSVHEWGRTVCQLEKYKSKKMSYAQMVSEADFDKEIYNYLCFIKNKFGIEDTGCYPPKVTPATDLAAYLERIKFTAKAQESFRRVLK